VPGRWSLRSTEPPHAVTAIIAPQAMARRNPSIDRSIANGGDGARRFVPTARLDSGASRTGTPGWNERFEP
jgi:hypothetical protein